MLLSFSAEACAILQALRWSRQHQQVCHFSSLLLLSGSRSVHATLVLPLHLSFYLKLSGRSGRNCPLSPPVLSGYNGSPDTRFSRGTTQLMGWPHGGRYLCPLQFLVVSFPYLSYSLFSFLGLEAYCLIYILQHTGFLVFH